MLPNQAISRIGRYEIKSLIGSGGMGTLYLARDTNPNTNRLVALKLLNANIDSTDLRERFGREARSLAASITPTSSTSTIPASTTGRPTS
jgi:serine/threonine protein kinase